MRHITITIHGTIAVFLNKSRCKTEDFNSNSTKIFLPNHFFATLLLFKNPYMVLTEVLYERIIFNHSEKNRNGLICVCNISESLIKW